MKISSWRHRGDQDLLPLTNNFPPMDLSAGILSVIRVDESAELITSPMRVHGFSMAREAATTTRAAEDSLRALRKAFAR